MHILCLLVGMFLCLLQSNGQDALIQTTDSLVKAQAKPRNQRPLNVSYYCSFIPGSAAEKSWFFTNEQSGAITEIHRKQSWPDNFEIVFHLSEGKLIRADVLLSDSIQAKFYYNQNISLFQSPFHGFTAVDLEEQSKSFLKEFEQRIKKTQ